MEKGHIITSDIYDIIKSKDLQLHQRLMKYEESQSVFYETYILTLFIGYVDIKLIPRIMDIFICCKVISWS